jgi:polyhydroxyalkanoate synthase
MHSYYLRNMYLENNLIKPNKLTMLGQPIDLGQVRCSCYVVGGQRDHIVPWQSAHRVRALVSGSTRPILGYGGHITSIINPPAKGRGFYFTNESDTTDSDQWLKTATRNEGSWWPDWVKWLRRRSGKKRPPPPMGNDDYPPLVSAPGTFVLDD